MPVTQTLENIGTDPVSTIEDNDPFGFGISDLNGGWQSSAPGPVPFSEAAEGIATSPAPSEDFDDAYDLPSAKSDTEKVNEVLGGMSFPISEEHVKSFRLDLDDLSCEEHVELAREVHNVIGKASGYLPDFNSQTENMKSAYLKAVRDVWIAAQRKARTYSE